jgi:hypothetical protein
MPAAEQLEHALNSFHVTDDAPPVFGSILDYIGRVAHAIIAYVHEQVADALELIDISALRARVTALEQCQPSSTSAATSNRQAPKSSSPVTTANRNIRCNRCHARGHTQPQCKSTNPDIVRKRVAKNRRANTATTAPLRFPTPLAPPIHAYSALAPPLEPYHLALAADAAELRRRADQSSRDKKRARANRASAPSTSK